MSKHQTVHLRDLKLSFFVRKALNQDHVLMLAELYEAAMLEAKGDSVIASKAVTAIQVTEDMVVIDGRHRKEAMEVAQMTEVRVEVLKSMTSSEAFVTAMRANQGGPLPASREDTIYNVEQMIGRYGMTQKAVEDALPSLPKSIIRKYINIANKRINEAKLKLAISDVSMAGLTLAQAAKKHGLKPEAVQLALEGKKPKSKLGAAAITSTLTTYTRAYTNQIGRVMNRALEDFRDGEVAEEVVQAAVNHFGHLLRRIFLRTEDWNNRVKAIRTGETEATNTTKGKDDYDIGSAKWTSKEK